MLRRLALIALVALAGCQSTRPADVPAPTDTPTLTPLGDATHWMLRDPLRVRLGDARPEVIIPAGFVTDFATIPPALQTVISPLGPHLLPSILHDYLYWNQSCTRRQADQIFRLALEEAEVNGLIRLALYESVRSPFGRGAWQQNAQEREAGAPRIIPRAGVRAPAPRELWPDYRRHLQAESVEARAGGGISAEFCAQGGPVTSPADS